jgi:hypothetical protein
MLKTKNGFVMTLTAATPARSFLVLHPIANATESSTSSVRPSAHAAGPM